MTPAHPHALPIWPTLAAAYREWWRMLPVLRPLVINTFLIVLAMSALDEFIPAKLSEPELSGTIITLLEAALRALLLAPVVAAIHRFIILEEITKSLCASARRAGVPPFLCLAVRHRVARRIADRFSRADAGAQCFGRRQHGRLRRRGHCRLC